MGIGATGARAAIYRRVSTTEQEFNTSPENQEKQCQEYAKSHDYTVVADEFDVHTGAKLDSRAGLNAIRAIIRAHAVDNIIVWRLDRLTRRMWDLPKLLDEAEQHGVAIASVTERIDTSTPVGKMTAMALAFVAEQERESFRQRSESGRRVRAERGTPLVGPRPTYGYRWVEGEATRRGVKAKVALTPDAQTATVVQRIFQEIADGGSLRAVCAGLTRDGVPTPTGMATWDKSTLQRLLSQPAYWGEPAGYRFHWHEETRVEPISGRTHTVNVATPQDEASQVPLNTDLFPPLITRELAEAALGRIAIAKHAAIRGNLRPEDYLLRGGFIRCGHCGRVMTCRLQRNRRTGVERLQYRCTTHGTSPGACVNNTIEAGALDRPIWAWVEGVLRDPDIIAREVRKQAEGLNDPTANRRELVERQQAEIERQREKIARAIAKLDDEEASAPLLVELRKLATQAQEARAELEAIREERQHLELAHAALRQVAEWCQTVAANIETLTHGEKQVALHALNVEVTVWKPETHDPRWLARMRPLDQAARTLTSNQVQAAKEVDVRSGRGKGEACCTIGDIRVRMSPGSTQ